MGSVANVYELVVSRWAHSTARPVGIPYPGPLSGGAFAVRFAAYPSDLPSLFTFSSQVERKIQLSE